MDINNEYGTQTLQKMLLPLLKEFHRFCLDNGIMYSLAYGTLLGAVRHKGFIPWDDDVDIIVTRDNFIKICKLINKNTYLSWDYKTKSSLWLGKIKLSEQLTETVYPAMIDVFILDHTPDNKIIAKTKLFLIKFLQGTIKGKPDLSRFNFVMKVCAFSTWLLGLFIPSRIKFSLFENISQWGNNKYTHKVSCYNTIFGYLGQVFSSNMIQDYSLKPFEDTDLYVMDGYDEFLTIVYGDYMTPPSKKVGHHLHPEYSYSYK